MVYDINHCDGEAGGDAYQVYGQGLVDDVGHLLRVKRVHLERTVKHGGARREFGSNHDLDTNQPTNQPTNRPTII